MTAPLPHDEEPVVPPRSAEVIVVGGGPAGSTTATLLAKAGHDVVLLDKAQFPRHKACSEYINPAGVQILQELDVWERICRAKPHLMKRMIVHAPGGDRFAADFDRVQPGRMALGLSRYQLDAILLDHAASSGVRVIERAHVREVVREENRVVGVVATIHRNNHTLRANIVIGADGRHSVVARSLGLSRSVPAMKRTGLVAHFRDVQEIGDHGEMHIGRGCYAGIAPLEDGLFNVAFVTASDALTSRTDTVEAFFRAGLASLDGVADRLTGASQVGGVRGVGPMAHRLRRTAGDGYLLVGDAAGFLDPFTGDGIYEGLRGAQIAAPIVHEALVNDTVTGSSLAAYRTARLAEFGAKRAVSITVQGFIRTPWLMNYATGRMEQRRSVGEVLTGVLGNFRPATDALSPIFFAKMLRP